jgi:predicted dehydrogenase
LYYYVVINTINCKRSNNMLDGTRALEKPVRWAMIGGGKGSNIGYMHRSAATRDNNFELVAGAFDINPERGIEFGKSLGVSPDRCYPDYTTMFALEAKREDGIQFVSIATPNSTHFEIAKAALEADLHIVCEKPLCFTSEEAQILKKTALEHNRIVGITYGYSGHQLHRQARAMIENGDLGDIRIIDMQFAHEGNVVAVEETVPSIKWRYDPKFAGPSGVLGDVATHPYYIIESILPELKIKNLLCTRQSFIKTRQLEDNAYVLVNYHGGAVANIWASAVNCGAQHGHIIRIVGSKAAIQWNDEHPNQMTFEKYNEPVQILERGKPYLYPEALEEDRISGGHPEGLFEAWANLYRRFAIAMDAADRNDKAFLENFWYPGIEGGVEGVKFVEKCVESADKGSIWVDY